MKFICKKCQRVQERGERTRKCDAPNCNGELRQVAECLNGVSFHTMCRFTVEQLALLSPEQIEALFAGMAKVESAGKE